MIQIGTDYPIHTDVPLAVLQDRTVQQALATGYPRWLALPDGALRTLVERQAEAYRLRRRMLHAHAVAGRVHHARPRRGGGEGARGRDRPQQRPSPGAAGLVGPRFLFVGREWERKRGDAVVAAFARLREREPAATLDVVGGHPRLRAPGVTGHGDGPGTDVATLLGAATCLVVPSQVEPAGIVYVEAAAAGIASIGTTVGGAANVIGDAGRTVAPGDDGAFKAMLELADPDTARELGGRARERSGLHLARDGGACDEGAGPPIPGAAAAVPPLS